MEANTILEKNAKNVRRKGKEDGGGGRWEGMESNGIKSMQNGGSKGKKGHGE
jgi:hypothetical protein